MIVEESAKNYTMTFHGVDDLVEYTRDKVLAGDYRRNFYGVSSGRQAVKLARDGVPIVDAMAGVDVSALSSVRDMLSIRYDVSGGQVDVGRYLTGEPECMWDFVDESNRTNRVITIVSNLTSPARVSTAAFERRGRQVVALINAIDQAGFQVELWTEAIASEKMEKSSFGMGSDDPGRTVGCKVRVKTAGQVFDPQQVMFTMSHPAWYRVFNFEAWDTVPEPWSSALSMGFGKGFARTDVRGDWDEDTIYLPVLMSDNDPDVIGPVLEKLGMLVEAK